MDNTRTSTQEIPRTFFCESLYDHPELVTPDTVVLYEKMKDTMIEENGTALSLCNTTYRTNLHYAFYTQFKIKCTTMVNGISRI